MLVGFKRAKTIAFIKVDSSILKKNSNHNDNFYKPIAFNLISLPKYRNIHFIYDFLIDILTRKYSIFTEFNRFLPREITVFVVQSYIDCVPYFKDEL